jgi:hypothetical protein
MAGAEAGGLFSIHMVSPTSLIVDETGASQSHTRQRSSIGRPHSPQKSTTEALRRTSLPTRLQMLCPLLLEKARCKQPASPPEQRLSSHIRLRVSFDCADPAWHDDVPTSNRGQSPAKTTFQAHRGVSPTACGAHHPRNGAGRVACLPSRRKAANNPGLVLPGSQGAAAAFLSTFPPPPPSQPDALGKELRKKRLPMLERTLNKLMSSPKSPSSVTLI